MADAACLWAAGKQQLPSHGPDCKSTEVHAERQQPHSDFARDGQLCTKAPAMSSGGKQPMHSVVL